MNKGAFYKLSYGLYVITSGVEGKFNGQIANTVFQVTSEPPTVAVSINKQNYTHECIQSSRRFAVSILEEATPMTMIGQFGFKCGRDINKFDGIQVRTGKTGDSYRHQSCRRIHRGGSDRRDGLRHPYPLSRAGRGVRHPRQYGGTDDLCLLPQDQGRKIAEKRAHLPEGGASAARSLKPRRRHATPARSAATSTTRKREIRRGRSSREPALKTSRRSGSAPFAVQEKDKFEKEG